MPNKSKTPPIRTDAMEYILAIDQGTTSTTVLLVNQNGMIVAENSSEIPQHYPKSGYVEHQAHEIKHSIEVGITKLFEKCSIKFSQVAGIGITNQRETTCLFDKNSQSPIPFIVWQCRRSAEICAEFKARSHSATNKTGLCLDPYFSASKLVWIFRHYPDLLRKAQSHDILFGTIDSFLCHWLSGGELHITDVTNASRTLLMDLSSCAWDPELLDFFSIPPQALPTITKNIGPFGITKGLSFLPDGIPLLSLIGDQQAALFGQKCFSEGDAKATFGTGSFILLNTGHQAIFSHHGLLTSIAYHINERPYYCLEGSAFIAGALIQFLRDNLGLISTSREVDLLAAGVPDNGGVLFVPALCGLSAPHWKPDARGILCGLDRGTQKGHIARAALEGIALQNADIMQSMAEDALEPFFLKVDGGAAQSDLLMQIQADLLGIACLRPKSTQKTALGAAYLAGLACGMFQDLNHLKSIPEDVDEFAPNPDRSWANSIIGKYRQLIRRSF